MTTGQEHFPKFEPAFRALEQLVADIFEAESHERPDEVSVYVFGEHGTNGVRIGELSAVWKRPNGGSGGCSYMRSDGAECGSVLLSAEDFLLSYGAEPEWDMSHADEGPIIDLENEARWRLAFAMTGKDADVAAKFWVKRERPAA